MGMIMTIIIFIVYVFLITVLVQLIIRRAGIAMEKTIYEKKKTYQGLVGKKNALYDRKMTLEEEAVKVFTLYEITKDITKSLNDETAFAIFKHKLAEHVYFDECRLLDPLAQEARSFRREDGYFVFTLQGKHRKIGYLVFRGLPESDKEKAMILGQQFALALRRVKLYEEIEKTAITDSLTDVYTRRYALERFKEEIGRAKERKMKISFLMIDVDHFKTLNDKYGHLAGDQILKVVGQIIRTSIREIDIAGRYGGEEFCIILPDTDTDGAQFAAERIRKATEATAIKAYDKETHVTVSIGVSTSPQDGDTMTELIDKADWALYRAKKHGRNCTCVFGIFDQEAPSV